MINLAHQCWRVLSSLLFIIVMQALSGEFKTSCTWELLYADDLVLMAVTHATYFKYFFTFVDFPLHSQGEWSSIRPLVSVT